MAGKEKSEKATQAALAQGDKYLRHLLADEDLRTSLLGAYVAARSAYGRLGNGKGPTHGLFDDPELQRELLNAATALRDASNTLKEPAPEPGRRRRRRRRRSLTLLAVGAVLAIVISSDLRSKVLDMLFGAEEEFDYTSTTTPATPAPAAVAGS